MLELDEPVPASLPVLRILAVVDQAWPWSEQEFSAGFSACPTFTNCEVTRVFASKDLSSE